MFIALGFTAGFIGAAAVLLTATLMFYIGISPALGVKSPLSLAPPGVYRPLVWGGLWGIPPVSAPMGVIHSAGTPSAFAFSTAASPVELNGPNSFS